MESALGLLPRSSFILVRGSSKHGGASYLNYIAPSEPRIQAGQINEWIDSFYKNPKSAANAGNVLLMTEKQKKLFSSIGNKESTVTENKETKVEL